MMKEYTVSLLVRVEDSVLQKYGNGVEDMVRWSFSDVIEFEYNVLGSYENGTEEEEGDSDWLA